MDDDTLFVIQQLALESDNRWGPPYDPELNYDEYEVSIGFESLYTVTITEAYLDSFINCMIDVFGTTGFWLGFSFITSFEFALFAGLILQNFMQIVSNKIIDEHHEKKLEHTVQNHQDQNPDMTVSPSFYTRQVCKLWKLRARISTSVDRKLSENYIFPYLRNEISSRNDCIDSHHNVRSPIIDTPPKKDK